MAGLRSKLRKSRRRFSRREDGSPSVETVLWLPFFMVVFGFIVDASMIFFGQAKMLRVVQDANRYLSVGRLEDPAATAAYVQTTLADIGVPVTVTSGEGDPGVITTYATTTVNQLEILGTFSFLAGRDLTIVAHADHMIEDWEG